MKILSFTREYPELRPLPKGFSDSPSSMHHFHPDRKVALPTMEGVNFERVNLIVSLEAKGNYTCIHFVGGRQVLVCKTLRDMEAMLKRNTQFVRVHRSHTINLNHIQKYIKGKGGYIIMESGESINVSAGKKQQFLTALEHYFG